MCTLRAAVSRSLGGALTGACQSICKVKVTSKRTGSILFSFKTSNSGGTMLEGMLRLNGIEVDFHFPGGERIVLRGMSRREDHLAAWLALPADSSSRPFEVRISALKAAGNRLLVAARYRGKWLRDHELDINHPVVYQGVRTPEEGRTGELFIDVRRGDEIAAQFKLVFHPVRAPVRRSRR